MFSRKDADLVNRMQKGYPHIISIVDISHCINLVCQYALKKFPSDPITMIKLVCSHFSRSSLRKIKFNEIQKRFSEDEFPERQILGYTPTRWSSLFQAIQRILSLWEPLEIYFDENKEFEHIILNFNDESRDILELLLCLLDKLNTLTIYFQNPELDFSKAYSKVKQAFCVWAQSIIKSEYSDFEALMSIPMDNETKLEPFLKSNEDFKAEFLKKYPLFDVLKVTKGYAYVERLCDIAREFIISALQKMREKLPFKDVFLENCQVVSLNNFNSEKWMNLAGRFSNIIGPKDLTSFIHEPESFEFEFVTLQTEFRKANNTIVYWGSVQGYPNMKS